MRTLFRPQVILVAVIAALAALGGPPALAQADEETINATVTAKVICISISAGGTINYGVVQPGVAMEAPTTTTGNNCGTVDEDFDIRGTDSAAWTLASSASGTTDYAHEFSFDPFSSWTALPAAATFEHLQDPVTTGSPDVTFKLRVTPPPDTTVTATQTVNVDVVATES